MNVESIRNNCLDLPSVTESLKWGKDLCFLVGGKMFFVVILDDTPSVSFKVTDEKFEILIGQPFIKPAQYAARFKWVLVENIEIFTDKNWKEIINSSYELVKATLSQKQQKSLN